MSQDIAVRNFEFDTSQINGKQDVTYLNLRVLTLRTAVDFIKTWTTKYKSKPGFGYSSIVYH